MLVSQTEHGCNTHIRHVTELTPGCGALPDHLSASMDAVPESTGDRQNHVVMATASRLDLLVSRLGKFPAKVGQLGTQYFRVRQQWSGIDHPGIHGGIQPTNEQFLGNAVDTSIL